MQRPIFLLVSGDGLRLDALRDDLSRRYQADYQVSVAGSAAAALTMLAVQAGSDAEVALVIANERLVDMPAVDFLARAHGLHPGAKRILLINHGDWSPGHPAILLARAPGSATTSGSPAACPERTWPAGQSTRRGCSGPASRSAPPMA